MKKIVIGLICFLSMQVSADAAKKPNILVILADDMHWHHPGFNGGPAATPNLDRLAHEGVMLTQFYVHSVCSPTRAVSSGAVSPVRDYVFNEMGASRAVKTKEWSYMTLRFTTDQVKEMRKKEK